MPGLLHGPAPALDVVGDRVADRRGLRDAAHAGDVLVAVLQQVADGELGAADVVRDDRDVVDGLGALVQQHDPGVPGLDLGGGVVVEPWLTRISPETRMPRKARR